MDTVDGSTESSGAAHRPSSASLTSACFTAQFTTSAEQSISTAVFSGGHQLANSSKTTSPLLSSSSSAAAATAVLVASTEYKECANCGVNDTPLWRKYNDHDLCNACGIYFRVNGFHRPFLPNMRKLLSSARKMGLSCVNCSTKITSMWRRTPEGESICNACGLYYRLNGVKRPVSMRKDWIRKRQRKTQQISGIMRLANQTILSTSVVEQQQQQQQQIGSVNSSGVSQQQQQQQQLPLIPQHESSSFDSNQQQQQQQQLNQLNQSSQCFQLVNEVHDVCSNELVQQQPDQHSSTQQNQENHYHHQKTFDYSLQYYDFGQTFQQQQQQPMSDHHQHSCHEKQLQPLMNSSSLSYMPQQQQHNSSTTMNLVPSYIEQVPIECTNGAVYSSNTSYHHHDQEDIKEVVHHHHHHLQHQHQ